MESLPPDVLVRTIETRTHGRYLVRRPATPPPWPLLLGFHGYGEDAETHLRALAPIPGIERWLVVAVQALHRFYTRRQEIVASWMTRQDRDAAISDNLAYVDRVLTEVRRDHPTRRPLVCAGFSQGGAMAYRAAAAHRAEGVIVLAADVPPDVMDLGPGRLGQVLIGIGSGDAWYTADALHTDLAALQTLGVEVETCRFEGGHEWTAPFHAAAGRLLARVAL